MVCPETEPGPPLPPVGEKTVVRLLTMICLFLSLDYVESVWIIIIVEKYDVSTPLSR